MFVLRLIGLADGTRTDVEGMFVRTYTADGSGGRGSLTVTDDMRKAKRYRSGVEALEDWKRVSRSHPTRRDGKPNRPLSAYSVEIMRTPDP